MAREHAPRVGVDDRHAPAGAVAQDRVGGLAARFPTRRAARRRSRRERPLRERAQAARVEVPRCERAQLLRLDPEVAGGAHELRELLLAQGEEERRREARACLQARERTLDVGPGRVLRQDRAHQHLEGRLGRPPALRPEAARELAEAGARAPDRARSAAVARDSVRRRGRAAETKGVRSSPGSPSRSRQRRAGAHRVHRGASRPSSPRAAWVHVGEIVPGRAVERDSAERDSASPFLPGALCGGRAARACRAAPRPSLIRAAPRCGPPPAR